jgi:uncharacterized protein YtpQ (UPF0354 family)
MLFNIVKSIKTLLSKAQTKENNSGKINTPMMEPMPKVYPRIKHVNFLDVIMNIDDMPESSRPIVETLVGDLLLSYAIDTGDSYISVSLDMLNKHGANPEELRPLAEENALDAMREIRQHEGLVNKLTTIDNLITCSILYPALWNQIKNEMGGDIFVAFPNRDTVFYVRDDNEEAVTELLRIINEDIDFCETHALSKLLYRLVDDKWQVVNT